MLSFATATRRGIVKLAAGMALLCLAQVLLSPTETALAGQPLYGFAATPHWVTPLSPEYEAPLPAGGVSRGSWDLLLDRQINVTADGHDLYEHFATKVITASGVDEQSQINIEVDPARESLWLHSLWVVRQGRVNDQTHAARIAALPQETELRERIYNGTYNINILLSDVRVGDVIEFTCTIHSKERLFAGRFATRQRVGWNTTTHRQRLRILSPASTELSYRLDDGRSAHDPAARSAVHDGLREIQWEWSDQPAIHGDEDRPTWYSPWPHIEASTWKDWSDVAQQVTALFAVKQQDAAAVTDVVREIRAGGGTAEQQALRALQFVQEQIRYVSISIAPGGFRPTPPATVLQRRFGDCKDKSLLLVTILRELGIEAHPALVSTTHGHVLDSVLPMPYAFDHAIVHMKLGAAVFWLDGTGEKQFSISANSPPDFQRALVLDDATTGLTVIPRPSPEASGKKSEVLFDARAGSNKPARLEISTFYHGSLADSERQSIADESPGQLQANYLDYIVQYYPGAKSSAPLAIHDDLQRNVLEVREFYSIDPPFTRHENGRQELFLQADEIYNYLKSLKSRARTAPLAIDYPIHVQQTMRALLPVLDRKWQVRNETVRIDNPAFRYKSVVSFSEAGNEPTLTADYSYESLSDFVEVDALPKYEADRKQAYDDAGYSTWVPAVASAQEQALRKLLYPGPLAPAPLLTALLSLFLGVFLFIGFVVRWDPPPAQSKVGWPAGIRGWLVLPAILVALTPFTSGLSLYRLSRLVDVDSWARLHDTMPGPWKTWAPAILLALTACGVLILVYQLFLIKLFFGRRTSAPRLWIILEWALVVYNSAVLTFPAAVHLTAAVPAARLARILLSNIVWAVALTAYMLLSRRVKATFVARFAKRNVLIPEPARSFKTEG
jgi:transglutaminase-like putative cysteine protease